ncbi:hypothetical protein [Clostridium sp. 'White wine YQ']|nr:hypothetical protein [Clostridium sp. 'White wine YQ']MDD7795015.1 hypothetical protein [Clostridium sp. 'White wine YQ']
MKDMKKQLLTKIGEASSKLSDKAMGKCIILGLYEPKIPAEMLRKNEDK